MDTIEHLMNNNLLYNNTPNLITNHAAANGGQTSVPGNIYYMDLGGTTNMLNDTTFSVPREEQLEGYGEMFQLLSSWGFSDLHEHFLNLKLNIDRLKVIDNEDLKEVFANKSLGVKVEFKHKLFQWRRENGIAIHTDLSESLANSIKTLVEQHLKQLNTTSTQCISRTPSPTPSTSSNWSNPASSVIGIQNFDIDAILTEHPSGKFVVADFEENGRIGDSSRSVLIDILSSWLLKNKKSVTRNEFVYIAEKIHERLGEEKTIYFDPPSRRSKESPSGRLYSRYYNLKKRYRKIGLNIFSNPSTEELEDYAENSLADKRWLQLHTQPWDEVKLKWMNTYRIRRKDAHSLNFPSFINDWPLLKHSFGVTLINSDFESKYPKKSNSLIERWENFKSLIVPIFNEKVKDKFCLELLSDLNQQNFTKAPDDVLIVNLLHATLPPSSMHSKAEGLSRKRKYFKPTIKDSQQSMILPVNEPNDFNQAIDRLVSKLGEFGQSLQPLIIFCTYDSSYIVYYNEILYQFNSLLPALDTCFKVFFVLNLDYPTASRSVWGFIQNFFYEINLKERVPADTIVLIENLKLKQKFIDAINVTRV